MAMLIHDTERADTQAAEASPSPLPVYPHVPSHLRLWLVAAVGLTADLWSKHWAFTELSPGRGEVVIPHLMRFQRSLNTGALFGLGASTRQLDTGTFRMILLAWVVTLPVAAALGAVGYRVFSGMFPQ